jgi:hypothetical protein
MKLVLDLMSEAEFSSIKALNSLFLFHRTFRLFLEEYPSLLESIEDQLEKFIKDPEQRHKDNSPNLGRLLAFITVSKKFTWKQFIESYVQEQMDRQVFWMINEIPELKNIDTDEKSEVDKHRAEVAFKTGIVGFHITLFFNAFNSLILESSGDKAKSMVSMAADMDKNCGQLADKLQDKLQASCEQIKE